MEIATIGSNLPPAFDFRAAGCLNEVSHAEYVLLVDSQEIVYPERDRLAALDAYEQETAEDTPTEAQKEVVLLKRYHFFGTDEVEEDTIKTNC